MGVYINMEMSTTPVLFCIHPDGKVFADIDGGWREYKAVPVPPHGRLIEAEPIMKFITDGLNSGEFGYDQTKVLTEIQYAPTIIPAEPAEEGE